MPDGSRRPIEMIEYDDRSSAEEVVRGGAALKPEGPPIGSGSG